MNRELREARNRYYNYRDNDAFFNRYISLLMQEGFRLKVLQESVARLTLPWPWARDEVNVDLDRVNEIGNIVYTWGVGEHPAQSRYFFSYDSGFDWFTGGQHGWNTYNTDQDGYFGVWVNPDKRLILSYVEGDVTLVIAPTPKSFAAEIAHMDAFYHQVGPDPSTAIYEFEEFRPEPDHEAFDEGGGDGEVSRGHEEYGCDVGFHDERPEDFDYVDYDQDAGDITTEDYQQFYQYGTLYHIGDAESLNAAFERDSFWPNIFHVSDHGNFMQVIIVRRLLGEDNG